MRFDLSSVQLAGAPRCRAAVATATPPFRPFGPCAPPVEPLAEVGGPLCAGAGHAEPPRFDCERVGGIPSEVVATIALACIAATGAASVVAALAALALHESELRSRQLLLLGATAAGVNTLAQVRAHAVRSRPAYRGYGVRESGRLMGLRYACWATSVSVQSLLVVVLRGPFRHDTFDAGALVGRVDYDRCLTLVPLLTFASMVAGGAASSLVPAAIRRVNALCSCTDGQSVTFFWFRAVVAALVTLVAGALVLTASQIGLLTYGLIDADPDPDERSGAERQLALFQAATWVVIPIVSVGGGLCQLLCVLADVFDWVVLTQAANGCEVEVPLTLYCAELVISVALVLTEGKWGFAPLQVTEDECTIEVDVDKSDIVMQQLLDAVAQIGDVVVHAGAAAGVTLIAFDL